MSQPVKNGSAPSGVPTTSPATPAGLPVVTVPAGYKLIRDESPEDYELRTQLEREALAAECALPLSDRVQKVADKKYPPTPGLKLWRVDLNDRNGFPRLVIPARSAREARVCYEDVCGILSVEEPDKKYDIEEVNPDNADANAKHAANASR